MIQTIKNEKWIIATSLVCITFGLLTFFTFINRSFIKLNDFNLQILLFVDLILLILFFVLIFRATYKILSERKKGKLGSGTSLRYIIIFSTTTLLPSVLIAIFSLVLFTVGVEKYFDKQIKSVVNNSTEVARNYLAESRNSVEADILLMFIDINSKAGLFYDNPKRFLNLLTSQRLLRRLDEVYLLDSAGEIVMSNIVDPSLDFVSPPDEAFTKSLDGKPVRITDPNTNRTSALVKLSNFIDTYLYIVKFMDPKVINYIRQTEQAVSFYYGVQNHKTGIKITFAFIYVLIVSLLLFLSIIISINFASRLTRPIINLISASEKISSGDLNSQVPKIETDREFKKLNENFNSMIDKLKKQQDKLLLSERHTAWENVARKLAHEIKNPLTPIQLSIDRIKEKYLQKADSDNKNLSNYLSTMTKQIKSIEHLVNEFSDFARMPKPVLKKIDLNRIVSNALHLHELSEPDIKFGISKIKSSNYVAGDDEQLNRVFINLIKNSIEAIYEKRNKNVDFKGKINIDIRNDNDYIYVTIEDNGVGLGHVDKEKILTPYFTTKKNGTGLGLAVVSKIISDHNSLILFNSINDGAGVEITIPKYDA
ncbi:MAG TPA: ATP-binding protein [Pelagibacteraceae bacterium]|jgi:two-component system nitrogen regulation sensor histidine kinase NtrY|nr:ATP-binding protein [Pelagibacteraceae bacterium]